MQTLNQFQQQFERYLNDHQFNRKPAALYQPVQYILSLGGKRLRPAVLMLAYYLFDDEVEKALPAAYAVEVFHNFSLVHDDIMDAAPLRRGMQTVHKKYGLNAGILAGDVMLASAFQYLLRIENKAAIPDIASIFTQMAIEVCEGQQMDMDFENENDVSIEAYLKMIELKTSVLVAASMQIGALLAGTSQQNAQRLYDFGKNLGIAFQLQDDLLDSFGNPEKVGKQKGGDIAQNKKTYLYLKAIELADDNHRNELLALYNQQGENLDKINAVMGIFRQLGIENETENMKEQYWSLAMKNLQEVECRQDRLELLERFAENLMQREF